MISVPRQARSAVQRNPHRRTMTLAQALEQEVRDNQAFITSKLGSKATKATLSQEGMTKKTHASQNEISSGASGMKRFGRQGRSQV